jgi:hypothetical protein
VIGVDLRWGITEEESQKGDTLPICLREIERSRPARRSRSRRTAMAM